MKQRVMTGLVIAIFVIAAFLLREISLFIFDTFIAMAVVFATAEVSRVFIRSGRANFMELAVVYSIATYLLFMWGIGQSFVFSQFLLSQFALIVIFFCLAFTICYFQKESLKKDENFIASKLSLYEYSIKKSFRTLFVMIYPALALSFIYLINHIQQLRLSAVALQSFAAVDLGLMVLLMTFLVTMATDTFAYFVGSKVGGPKLAPLISPKKTISGAIGGLAGGVLVSTLLFFVLNGIDTFNIAFFQAEITIVHFIVYGLLAAIVSQEGDLFASYIKRKARAKDFSSIFPGHGGFMDRLDGIAANAVFTFLFIMLIFL